MNDILMQDAIVYETILKSCSKCGHPRAEHINDKKCKVKDCNCKGYIK